MTDPIADMLTRIRNAVAKKQEVVEIPASKIKLAIAEILKQEGFIRDFHRAEWKGQGKLMVHLKYVGKEAAITGVKRVSRPGRRVYLHYREIKPVFDGRGIGVLSTPKGVLTDVSAKEKKLGGELLLNIW
jgi:small subunit ribosomal protein S8